MSARRRFKEGDKVRLVKIRRGEPLDPDNAKRGDEGFVLSELFQVEGADDLDYMVDFGGEAPDAFFDDELEACDE